MIASEFACELVSKTYRNLGIQIMCHAFSESVSFNTEILILNTQLFR
jgi:hypothetical protein